MQTSSQSLPGARGRAGKAVVIVLVALLVLGGAFAVYWFLLRGKGPKVVSDYIPADADMVGGLDVGTFLDSKLVSEATGVDLKQTIPWLDPEVEKLMADAGIKPTNLSQVTFAGDGIIPDTAAEAASGGPQLIAVTRGVFDKAKLVETFKKQFGGETKQFGGIDAMLSKVGGLAIPNNDVFVVGRGDLFGKSLELSRGKGESINDDEAMSSIRAVINQGATFWVASRIKLPQGIDIPIPGFDKLVKAALTATHAGVSVDLRNGFQAAAAVRFGDPASAKAAADAADSAVGALKLALLAAGSDARPAKLLLNGLEGVKADGPVVVARIALDEAQALELAKAFKDTL